MWQFVLTIEGLADACQAFNIPVVSGNVSFYNETNGLSIYPTPIVGMVGLIDPANSVTTQGFKNPGDRIIVLGETKEDLGGTEYLKVVHSREQGSPPWINLETEKLLQACVLSLIREGLVQSAHDCSEGGLAVTLAESCLSPSSGQDRPLGVRVQLSQNGLRRDALLFGETPSRVVLSVSPDRVDRVLEVAHGFDVPAAAIGEVGGEELRIHVLGETSGSCQVEVDLNTLSDCWYHSLERLVQDESHNTSSVT